MKTVNIFKAQSAYQAQTIESVTIVIDKPLPEITYNCLDEWRLVAKKEASALCDALCDALPQGVTDALLVELLDRKRSLFIVPMERNISTDRYYIDKKGIAHHPKDCQCMSCTHTGL